MAAFSDDAPSLSELCQAHRELSTALQGLSLIFQETCRHIPDDEPEGDPRWGGGHQALIVRVVTDLSGRRPS